MKHILAIFATLAFSGSLHAAVQGHNLDGWLLEQVDTKSFMSRLTGGAIAVLFQKTENPETEAGALIRVYSRGKADIAALGKDPLAWRNAMFSAKSLKRFVFLKERVIKHGDELRYYAEYQSDTGTETMLRTAVSGIILNGELLKLNYEQSPRRYSKEIGAISAALQTIQLK